MSNPSSASIAQGTTVKGVITETVSTEFVASTKKLVRTTGSWITSGFSVGMALTTTDAANLSVGIVTVISALEMTVNGTVVDAAAGSETITGKATIGEIKSFTGPGGQAADIDVTTLESTGKEFLQGLKDEGEFSFECNLDPSDCGQVFCRSARDSQTRRTYEVVFPDDDDTTLTFLANCKGFSVSGGVDDVLKASVSLRISGAVTWS